VDVDEVVQDVNRFLRGWAGYFRYGNSARQFDKIDHYAQDRLARFVAKRQAQLGLRAEGSSLPITRPARVDQPRGNHRRATAQPALAPGTLNAGGEERRGAVCGREQPTRLRPSW